MTGGYEPHVPEERTDGGPETGSQSQDPPLGSRDGGPAFPVDLVNAPAALHGMTLRDYFAAQALDELIYGGHNPAWDVVEAEAQQMAQKCYMIADAMLRQRQSQPCSIEDSVALLRERDKP